MIIRPEAIAVIENALKETGMDYCHFGFVTHSCGGRGLDIRLIKKEEVTRLVDCGIQIDMSEEDDQLLKDFVIEGEGESIRVIPPEDWDAPGACDCGCEDDCDCGDHCDCGHHHH